MTTSNFGTERARREAKAKADQDTQHALWVERLRSIVGECGLPAADAYLVLAVEAQTWIAEDPPRKAQRLAVWCEFERKVRASKGGTP